MAGVGGTSRPRGNPGRGRSRRRPEGGRAGPEAKPRRPGRWRRGREPLASLPWGHLGQAPRGPGRQGGRPECLSAGPDFSAQPSSRNARAAPARQRPRLRIRGGARRGSRPGSAPSSRTTPDWSLPCPRPQFPSRWNKDLVRTRAIRGFRSAAVLVPAVGTTYIPSLSAAGSLVATGPSAPSAVPLKKWIDASEKAPHLHLLSCFFLLMLNPDSRFVWASLALLSGGNP